MKQRDFPRVGILPSGASGRHYRCRRDPCRTLYVERWSDSDGVTVVVSNDDPLLKRPLAATVVFTVCKSMGLSDCRAGMS